MDQKIDDIVALKVISAIAVISLAVYAGVRPYTDNPVPDFLIFYLFVCWLYCLVITPRQCRLGVQTNNLFLVIPILGSLLGILSLYIVYLFRMRPSVENALNWLLFFLPILICTIWTIRGVDWYLAAPKLHDTSSAIVIKCEEKVATLYDFFAQKAPWLVPGFFVATGLFFGISVLTQMKIAELKDQENARKAQAVLQEQAALKQQELEMLRELALLAERDRIESEKRKARQDYIDATAEGVAKGISEGIKRSRRN